MAPSPPGFLLLVGFRVWGGSLVSGVMGSGFGVFYGFCDLVFFWQVRRLASSVVFDLYLGAGGLRVSVQPSSPN